MTGEATRSEASVHPEVDGAMARLLDRRPPSERPLLQHAFELARRAHEGQRRRSGDPYIVHPVAVAVILDELRLDHETLAAALLHDVLEDTELDLERLQQEVGPTVAGLVQGVTRMEVLAGFGQQGRGNADERQQVDRLKKLLLAMTGDVRVVLVKLADRLHNMRTLRHLDAEERGRIARETLDIYAPLASRLGIAQFKWEMEDLGLRELDPATYTTIARQLDERRTRRERYVGKVVNVLQAKLGGEGIKADVYGRVKHIYSIWRKMQEKGLSFDQVFDMRAVRILVDDVADCYAALGVVHTQWKHVAKEFDDYIANPKSNRYQSLHTAVLGPEGRTLEVQIRTHEMHVHAEHGVAAHWRYKEGATDPRKEVEAKVGWLKQILEVKDDSEGPRDFLDRFNRELANDRVYVVTPRGQVLDLPVGSTPLDFAYQVHTDVGHRCRGARVNGAMVPLTRALRSGDQVEILTTRNAAPSRDWLSPHLGYLVTPRARARVRHWFKHRDRDKNVSSGHEILEREQRRLGVSAPDRDWLMKRFNFRAFDDFLAGIGCGDVSSAQLAGALQHLMPRAPPPPPPPPRRHSSSSPVSGIQVQGVGNLLTQMARCCQPVPGDEIVGFVTRGRGVSIHRRDCRNMLRLDAERKARLVDVSWPASGPDTYAVRVTVSAFDRKGLLRDVTAVLTAQDVNIDALDTENVARDRTARIQMTLQVADLAHLARALDLIGQLPNVFEARRTG